MTQLDFSKKPLILCKKAVRKHFKSWVSMVSVQVNHKVYHFSWENQPCGGTRFGRILPTLNDCDLGISNRRVIRQLIGFRWPWGGCIIGVIRASNKVGSRLGPCCTFRVCCCLLCVSAALWVVQWQPCLWHSQQRAWFLHLDSILRCAVK